MKTAWLSKTSKQQLHSLAREVGILLGLTCRHTGTLGEADYISLPIFRRLLTHFGVTHSYHQFRAWLTLPRQHLPPALQCLLTHAAEQWYLVRPRGRGGRDGRRYAIPLHFLSGDAQHYVRAHTLVRRDISHNTLTYTIVQLLRTNPRLRSTDIHRHLLKEGYSIHYQAVRKAVGTIKLGGLHATLGHDSNQPTRREARVQGPLSPTRGA